MSYLIKDKVALVTGANRGIGKAIVETFLEKGVSKVYLAVRNTNSTAYLEKKYGSKVVTIKIDVTDTQSILDAAKVATDVDIIVNNAGVGMSHFTIAENAEADLKKQLDVNTFGLLRIANAFADILVNHKGALVQMNTVASIKNIPEVSTYSASKAASYSLTQGIKADLAPKGVSVVSVHPGPIDTDMAASLGIKDAFSPRVVAEGIINALANGDFHLFPDEMSKMVGKAYESFADNIIAAELSI